MMKCSVDSFTSQLIIGTNCMSISLLQHVQITLSDIVLQIYKPDFCFKPRTWLHIVPWWWSELINAAILVSRLYFSGVLILRFHCGTCSGRSLLDLSSLDISLMQEGLTPMYFASQCNDSRLVELLLAHGADINRVQTFSKHAVEQHIHVSN